MDAIGIEHGDDKPRLLDIPRPEPTGGEVLVRTLRVGVDGTDHEVIDGSHGSFPEGNDYLVLGHEAVGVVEEPNGTRFKRGDIVAPTVRRPPTNEGNEYFERGEADMAPPEKTLECGIDGAHGFMSEYFTSSEEFLVSVPKHLAPVGFLIEPISITEKALELAHAARSSFSWQPESAFVLGNGSLGLLTVAMLVDGMRVYCLGRRERPDPSIDIIEDLGATYVDSRVTPVDAVPSIHEPMDLVYEATGFAKHPFESIDALAPNGVAALLGVPESWSFEIDGGRLHKEFVMQNKALVGSVNSALEDFRAAIDTLDTMPEWFIDDFVTTVAPYRDYERAFERGATTLKTGVEFGKL